MNGSVTDTRATLAGLPSAYFVQPVGILPVTCSPLVIFDDNWKQCPTTDSGSSVKLSKCRSRKYLKLIRQIKLAVPECGCVVRAIVIA